MVIVFCGIPDQTIFPFVEYPSSTIESTARICVIGKLLPSFVYSQNFDCDDLYFRKNCVI